MEVETLGVARSLGWKVHMRCANGYRQETRSMRRCVYRKQLDVEYARDSIGFRWAGCEEGDEVEGEGTAELLDDGTIEIEFAYHNGDEAVLKVKRVTSSTAC
jgi:hypothetical protein